jgi:1,4-dihydroxy-2-naphthoate octaprenyltransferase
MSTVITILSAKHMGGLEPLLGTFLGFFWLFNIIDAVRMANLYNDALTGLDDAELKRSLARAGAKGTIGGGVAFLVVGLLILLHNAFGMSMYWLEDWWPIIPIAFGAYLLYQGISDRRKRAA